MKRWTQEEWDTMCAKRGYPRPLPFHPFKRPAPIWTILQVVAFLAFLGLVVMTVRAARADEPSKPKLCTVFSLLDRTCASVKLMTRMYGPVKAEALARKCGASDDEIEQAKICLK